MPTSDNSIGSISTWLLNCTFVVIYAEMDNRNDVGLCCSVEKSVFLFFSVGVATALEICVCIQASDFLQIQSKKKRVFECVHITFLLTLVYKLKLRQRII